VEDNTALVAVEPGGLGWPVEVTLFSDTGREAVVERTWKLFDPPGTLGALVDRLAEARIGDRKP